MTFSNLPGHMELLLSLWWISVVNKNTNVYPVKSRVTLYQVLQLLLFIHFFLSCLFFFIPYHFISKSQQPSIFPNLFRNISHCVP